MELSDTITTDSLRKSLKIIHKSNQGFCSRSGGPDLEMLRRESLKKSNDSVADGEGPDLEILDTSGD